MKMKWKIDIFHKKYYYVLTFELTRLMHISIFDLRAIYYTPIPMNLLTIFIIYFHYNTKLLDKNVQTFILV